MYGSYNIVYNMLLTQPVRTSAVGELDPTAFYLLLPAPNGIAVVEGVEKVN